MKTPQSVWLATVHYQPLVQMHGLEALYRMTIYSPSLSFSGTFRNTTGLLISDKSGIWTFFYLRCSFKSLKELIEHAYLIAASNNNSVCELI